MSKKILIIGGAGFIGINAVDYFLRKNFQVLILDNLSRKGTDYNLKWLKGRWGKKVKFIKADIVKDRTKLNQAVRKVDFIIHLAAQVAVTTSVKNPYEDFFINALGTLHVLEAIRLSPNKPMLIYSSTNKVYGEIANEPIILTKNGYRYKNIPKGISEDCQHNFHSPYGCSKGSADQYVRDYSRIYGLKTVVFRQSCIYGPHQFGVEDQGWIAWFTIAMTIDKPIIIYGDGNQSRDLLYVDDLCELYDLAIKKISRANGQIYNIGGGSKNILSVLSVLSLLNKKLNKKNKISFSNWRPGDQKIYVSDIQKVYKDLGWKPQTTFNKGLERLISWAKSEEKTLRKFNK
mgnify:CR=1 FL=1